MREAFAEHLADLEQRILSDLEHAADALTTVAAAVQDPARQRIKRIAFDGRTLRGKALEAHAELVSLTARQAPVAGDLRLVLALIEVSHHTALIANQFALISEQLANLDPEVADPDNTSDKLARMASIASIQLRKATGSFRHRDLAAARELDPADDQLDLLNRQIADTATCTGATTEQRELEFRHVLIARSLERIGDNAVDIAEQAAFLLTGRSNSPTHPTPTAAAEPDRRAPPRGPRHRSRRFAHALADADAQLTAVVDWTPST